MSDFAVGVAKLWHVNSLVLLVEDNEREVKRGKTRLWLKRRQEKGYFANIVQELMIEDVAGYRVKSVVSLSVHVFLGDFFEFLQNSNCAPLSAMFTNDV